MCFKPRCNRRERLAQYKLKRLIRKKGVENEQRAKTQKELDFVFHQDHIKVHLKASVAATPALTLSAVAATLPGRSSGPPGTYQVAGSTTRFAAAALTTAVQVASEFTRYRLQVHEVAETRPGTFPHFILATASFTEVSDRTKLGIHRTTSKPAVVQIIDRFLCVFLTAELDVDIAHQVITQVVTHVHLFNLPILIFTLNKYIFKEIVIMLLHFFI